MKKGSAIKQAILVAVAFVFAMPSIAPAGSRARDLGIPFDGTPGPNNAITDVAGVEVGHTTLIRSSGKLERGKGPVRTGVTIIHPMGKAGIDAVAAGFSTINGTGEFTGTRMIDETGLLIGPIALTGTGNLPVVQQAMTDWGARPGYLPEDLVYWRLLPVVGETLDLRLNDVFGHPMTEQDVFVALDRASAGPVEEGNVGGGTGMVAYGFKGGIGTASRTITEGDKSYMVGVLIQANHGKRADLRIAGVPIGQELPLDDDPANSTRIAEPAVKNSLLVVIATDAPLAPHQLNRLARRAALGIGRNGSTAGNQSGEFVLAFSTSNTTSLAGGSPAGGSVSDVDDALMNALFHAVVQGVEEALVNQLVASQTMTGANGLTVYGLPHDQLKEIMKRHDRYRPSQKTTP
jgi:L-aminopeptidase/D-esterase-like protein